MSQLNPSSPSDKFRSNMKKQREVSKTKQNLTIVPTYVPRVSGNNPDGGERDLHYKIKE